VAVHRASGSGRRVLADPDGLEDVAELEHAALALRAPFDARGAPSAVAADLALALERRDDEFAAGMLAALATFSHQPLASEAANALAHLSARGTISALAGRIGKLEVIDASLPSGAGIDLVLRSCSARRSPARRSRWSRSTPTRAGR
jgi:hypothetical protein